MTEKRFLFIAAPLPIILFVSFFPSVASNSSAAAGIEAVLSLFLSFFLPRYCLWRVLLLAGAGLPAVGGFPFFLLAAAAA